MRTFWLFFFLCFTLPLISQAPELPRYEQELHQLQVYFDFGKHDIRAEFDSLLQEMAGQAQRDTQTQLIIIAHTDAIGSDRNNDLLSQKRAEEVKNYLSENGIAAERLFIRGYGEERPVASNDTDEGRQQNRRAEVLLVRNRPSTWIEGRITDQETGEGLPGEVIVGSKFGKDTFPSEPDGRFRVPAPRDEVVGLEITAPGYFFASKMMKTDDPSEMKPLEFKLPQVKSGAVFDLDNFYFFGGQAKLLPGSRPELPRLLNFMRANPDIHIEIAGHVNVPNQPRISKDNSSFDLSVRRARLVYDYLVKNGISGRRMEYAGYGNWEMRFPKAKTDEQMQANRRVEIRVR